MISSARPTLTELLERYYLPAKPTTRPPTIALYANTISLVDRFAGRVVFADELCNELVEAFRAWRLAAGRPASTVNKDVRHLLALWRLAQRKRLIGSPAESPPINTHARPDIEPLAEDLDPLPCWSMAELGRIVHQAGQEQDLFMSVPAGKFFPALVLAIYDVGPRITAIMTAAKTDLDWQSGTLALRARHGKGRRSQVIALSEETLAAIRAMGDYDGPWLFPWPYDRTQHGWQVLTRRYRGILKRAGLPTSRTDLFHRLRRTTGTHLYNELGMEAAQQHLGHSSSRVTQRYIDWSKVDETKRSARSLPRPPAPPPQPD